MKTPYDRLVKIYTNCSGHKINIAITPLFIVKQSISSSLELKGEWPCESVCSIGDVGPTRFAQMMKLG